MVPIIADIEFRDTAGTGLVIHVISQELEDTGFRVMQVPNAMFATLPDRIPCTTRTVMVLEDDLILPEIVGCLVLEDLDERQMSLVWILVPHHECVVMAARHDAIPMRRRPYIMAHMMRMIPE